MKKLALFISVLAIAAAGAGAWIYMRVGQPYRGYEGPDQLVEVPAGAGSRSIGDRLVAAGVVRDALSFRVGLYLSRQGRRLQAGEYRFDRAMSTAQVVDKIARGDVFVRSITFREGLTNREMAALFESAGLGSAADFLAAARRESLITDLDPELSRELRRSVPTTFRLPTPLGERRRE